MNDYFPGVVIVAFAIIVGLSISVSVILADNQRPSPRDGQGQSPPQPPPHTPPEDAGFDIAREAIHGDRPVNLNRTAIKWLMGISFALIAVSLLGLLHLWLATDEYNVIHPSALVTLCAIGMGGLAFVALYKGPQ